MVYKSSLLRGQIHLHLQNQHLQDKCVIIQDWTLLEMVTI